MSQVSCTPYDSTDIPIDNVEMSVQVDLFLSMLGDIRRGANFLPFFLVLGIAGYFWPNFRSIYDNTGARPAAKLHISACRLDLMEFFDEKKNWTEKEVKVGRSWKLEELRIKSNSDLHKLWYVLLKERNMLLTMEHAAKDVWASFPNPERLDKVEESMENLETVVRERNKAYWELEIGGTGERPFREEIAFTGLRYKYKLRQHRIPEIMNSSHRKFKEMMNRMDDRDYQKEFLSLYKEKRWAERRRKRVRDFNHVCGLLKRYPNMDLEAIKEQYPDVDLERASRTSRSRGHREDNLN